MKKAVSIGLLIILISHTASAWPGIYHLGKQTAHFCAATFLITNWFVLTHNINARFLKEKQNMKNPQDKLVNDQAMTVVQMYGHASLLAGIGLLLPRTMPNIRNITSIKVKEFFKKQS